MLAPLRHARAALLLAASAVPLAPVHALAAPSAEDMARSISLRADWQYLTREIAWPASWTPDGSAFSYRKTVEGGFAFETYDLRARAKTPAFDQQKLAKALGAAMGETIDPLRLPFDQFSWGPDRQSIGFGIDYAGWNCTLTDYHCAPEADPRRPRGFGVVRDHSMVSGS